MSSCVFRRSLLYANVVIPSILNEDLHLSDKKWFNSMGPIRLGGPNKIWGPDIDLRTPGKFFLWGPAHHCIHATSSNVCKWRDLSPFSFSFWNRTNSDLKITLIFFNTTLGYLHALAKFATAWQQGCGSGSGESGKFSWKRKLEAVQGYRLF